MLPWPAGREVTYAGSLGIGERREGASAGLSSLGTQRTENFAPVHRDKAHRLRRIGARWGLAARPLPQAGASPRLSTSSTCLMLKFSGLRSL